LHNPAGTSGSKIAAVLFPLSIRRAIFAKFFHMRQFFIILLLAGITVLCGGPESGKNLPGPPGEFEELEFIIITWNDTYVDRNAEQVQVELVRHLVDYVNIRIMVPTKYLITEVENILLRNNIPLRNVEFWLLPVHGQTRWVRDYGPLFFVDERGRMRIADFKLDGSVYERMDSFIATLLEMDAEGSSLFSQGGSREFNGAGTVLLVESFEKAMNPKMSRQDIEWEMRNKLFQKKVIWLKSGLPQDDLPQFGPIWEDVIPGGAGGHLDEFCRFADPSTILLAQVDSADLQAHPIYRIAHERLEQNNDILSAATDQDGRPFQIIRVPVPDLVIREYRGEEVAFSRKEMGLPISVDSIMKVAVPNSYLNFVVANNVVITSSYWQPGMSDYQRQKDQKVLEIFKDVFPDRKIVQLNAIDLNYMGGGLHCITSHKPKTNKRRKFSKPRIRT
jgi:agmatine deiminase